MFYKKIKLSIVALLAIFNLFIFSAPVFAANSNSMASDIAAQLDAASQDKGAGFGAARDPREIITTMIRRVLGFLGIIFICLTLYAGYLWMTAGGNEENVTKAKSLLTEAVAGLAIILSAYSITKAVVLLVMGTPLNTASGWTVQSPPTYFKGPGDY